jgi:hypothetical protein
VATVPMTNSTSINVTARWPRLDAFAFI